jgi:hypothetical protein
MRWVVSATRRPLYPRGIAPHPLYRRLGRSGRVRKISPSPGFDPRTIQLVPSRYIGLSIPAYLPNGTSSNHPPLTTRLVKLMFVTEVNTQKEEIGLGLSKYCDRNSQYIFANFKQTTRRSRAPRRKLLLHKTFSALLKADGSILYSPQPVS